ncbi:MAG: DUF2871 domain-containing protein [Filifactoraceae bacterium]
MKKILNTAIIYFIFAIIAGVFYREFTKFNNYIGITTLSYVHTHLFVLGMIFFLIIASFINKDSSLVKDKLFDRFFTLYNIALSMMVTMLIIRGVVQVINIELTAAMDSAISGIAGISHILITISLTMFFYLLKKHLIKNETQ